MILRKMKRFMHIRTLDNDKYVVIVNLSDEEALYKYDDLDLIYENLMLANSKSKRTWYFKEVVLKPEVVIQYKRIYYLMRLYYKI